MKKKIILRGVVGFPVGVAIGHIISILISFAWGNGYYAPCVPALISMMGSEINAVILQAFLSGVIGTGFAASSIVWDIEEWGVIKQSGVYFLLNALIMMPSAYCMYWMEHSASGIVSYIAYFALIYIAIWAILYGAGRYNVKKMNEGLYKAQSENEKT